MLSRMSFAGPVESAWATWPWTLQASCSACCPNLGREDYQQKHSIHIQKQIPDEIIDIDNRQGMIYLNSHFLTGVNLTDISQIDIYIIGFYPNGMLCSASIDVSSMFDPTTCHIWRRRRRCLPCRRCLRRRRSSLERMWKLPNAYIRVEIKLLIVRSAWQVGESSQDTCNQDTWREQSRQVGESNETTHRSLCLASWREQSDYSLIGESNQDSCTPCKTCR